MSILTVDDSEDFCRLIKKMLGDASSEELLFAGSARECFELLGLEGGGVRPDVDLILMDILMPEIDGIEAVRRIKADRVLHDVPVIMLTAVTEMDSLKQAFDAGACDYITKPPQEIELFARIRSALALKRECDTRKMHAEEFKKLAFVVEQNPSSIMILDMDFVIEYVNPACAEATGYRSEELVGEEVGMLRSGMHTPEFYDEIWKTVRGGKIWRGDVCSKRKNGEPVWELISISPITGDDGRPTHYVSRKIDDTERRIVEARLKSKKEELDRLSRELHDLAIEMSEFEDMERKSFAEMLHEDIGQGLFAIDLTWTALKNEMKGRECASGKLAGQIDALLKSTIKTTRSLTSKMYPALPEGISLADAITWYGDTLLKQNGVQFSFLLPDNIDALPEAARECLLRIVRESLQNIVKHAGAGSVEVNCVMDEGSLNLVVSDDGHGFLLEEVKGKKGRGIGLMLMRERVKELGGVFSIDSEPGKGTRINVLLPLEGTAEADERVLGSKG